MATKTFKGFTPQNIVTFELESPDGTRSIEIRCKPSVPGSKFLEFMAVAGPGGMDDLAALARVVRDVLNTSIADEDHEKFWGFVDDPANGIGLQQLSEIGGFVAEQLAGERPTVPSPG